MLKTKRVKYLRALEKSATRFAKALKKDKFDFELFKQVIQSNIIFLNKCEQIPLYSEYAKQLEEFVNECCFCEFDKERLLNKYNLLDKIKNNNSYKKEKHKKKIFDNY